jgi:uncharacterized membrane protein
MRKMLPAFLVTLALLAFSLWALPQLPDKVATHWGLDGQPDGWSSARFGALMLPGVMILMSALFAVLPSIDPLKKNYAFHGSVYFLFVNVIVGSWWSTCSCSAPRSGGRWTCAGCSPS